MIREDSNQDKFGVRLKNGSEYKLWCQSEKTRDEFAEQYRKKYKSSITKEQIKKFNNQVKSEYSYINKISENIDNIVESFTKTKEQKESLDKKKTRANRLNELIEEENINFINIIIQLGFCKSRLKNELCVNPDKLLLKDAFIRFFKLIISSI